MQKKSIRRGQLISPWGIGQMVNFPGDESLMVCGLDAWEAEYQRGRDGIDEWIIHEERLERRLGVSHFRLPPEFRKPGVGVKNPDLRIPSVRFPLWHYCPRCGSMEKLSLYGSQQRCTGPKYPDGMSCDSLSDRKRPWLIPVRFIAVCDLGHIEDFPFIGWVHGKHEASPNCRLRLRAGRNSSTLSGIVIECSCGLRKSMAGAFSENSLDKIKLCSGHRPWLGEIDEKSKSCGNALQVVQKGASNVYFPTVLSSIYLPQWDKTVGRKIVDILDKEWHLLTRHRVDGQLDKGIFEYVAEKKGILSSELYEAAQQRLMEGSEYSNSTADDLDSEEMYRRSEYDAILSSKGGDNQDFFVTRKESYEYGGIIERFFSSICLLHKLKETRTMVGFSRLLPEDGRPVSDKIGELSLGHIDWLPAITVKGEGIFFELNENLVEEWTLRPEVQQRANLLIENHSKYREQKGLEPVTISPKFILLHTLAHLLINQFIFESGYGSSALRERIYCNLEDFENPMHGILIYTASGDSEGSMGGLVRQGNPEKLEPIVMSAIFRALWCSSDPICMESEGQGPDSCNLAACHSCALLPETSCENGNRILDRGLVVGSLNESKVGYFYGFDDLDY